MGSKASYQYYKSKGICPNCLRNRAMQGNVLCVDCSTRRSERQKIRRANPEKRESSNAYQREVYHSRKRKGLCTLCGEQSSIGIRCERCALIKNTKRKERGRYAE